MYTFLPLPKGSADRFRRAVPSGLPPTACWPWSGILDTCGYGKLFIRGKYIGAHRVALALSLDREIQAGKHVLHSCHNRACCNPAHLREGTHLENIREAVAHGSFSRLPKGAAWWAIHGHEARGGEKNGNARLTAQQVVEIRRRAAAGEVKADLAREFRVEWVTINKIVKRLIWRRVDDA